MCYICVLFARVSIFGYASLSSGLALGLLASCRNLYFHVARERNRHRTKSVGDDSAELTSQVDLPYVPLSVEGLSLILVRLVVVADRCATMVVVSSLLALVSSLV